MNKELAEKLINMRDKDQRLLKREKLTSEIRNEHAEDLNRIIDEYGWPTISLVGNKASNSAWLIAQHSDQDVKFQEKCLELLKKAVGEDEASKQNLAYLTDRARRNKGKPQIFGTQLKHNKEKGKLEPQPIKDPENVDKRRKEYEMDPSTLEEYLQMAEKAWRKR